MTRKPEVSIVMAYHDRKEQVITTLKSIEKSKHANAIEVIIVDDASSLEHSLQEVVENSSLHIKLIEIKKSEKWWINPCVPYNMGFKEATADRIIIQNPECAHYGDIIDKTIEHLTDDNYLSFHCYSLNAADTTEYQKTGNVIFFPRGTIADGTSGFYNHYVYKRTALHFTSAISKSNLDKLGGFDEVYAYGIGYDDNDLIRRVAQMGLSIQFVENPLSIHQYHYSDSTVLLGTDKGALLHHNMLIYNKK